jgi:hypothetical protein
MKKIWLTEKGVKSNIDGKELMYAMTIQDINVGLFFYPELRQVHMSLDREDLIMIRDAINKQIEK